MRIALLGVDREVMPVAAAIAGSSEHVLAGICLDSSAGGAASGHLEEVRRLAPMARIVEGWESLLSDELAEAVVVARSGQGDLRDEQLRKLVGQAVPLLLMHPACDLMMHYELEMIARESGGILVPYLPARSHPAVRELLLLMQGDSPPGETRAVQPERVEQVILERNVGGRSRDEVWRQFAVDVDLLRAVAGELVRIAGMAGAETESDSANLSVQMVASSGTLVRWNTAPLEGDLEARLSIAGRRQKWELLMPAAGPWRLEMRGQASAESPSREYEQPLPSLALEQFSRAVAGRPTDVTWPDATRSMEVIDGLQKSLAKGRTVNVGAEEASEESAFKSAMTSLGCGILMLGAVLVVVTAVAQWVAARAGMRGLAGILGQWPLLLLAVLAVFLILQLLRLIIPTKSER